ncbi:MAG: dihydroneopterin aldolase [Gammaproteobacteria bacterium]|nr:MAG: dihydroneopterin aldolase [Gammaproteobacteria bacterium]|tara:strand:+ start:869 stop:1216 length:348 start_codon:yes stop_codon:yes gene_type:complete
MDKVFINNLAVEAIIGIFQWEREVRQLISIDIEMDFDNKQAAKSDNIEDALNYKLVGKRITGYVKNSKFKLVEALAENISKIILKEFPVSKVKVTLSKPGAMRGSDSVGISIVRP